MAKLQYEHGFIGTTITFALPTHAVQVSSIRIPRPILTAYPHVTIPDITRISTMGPPRITRTATTVGSPAHTTRHFRTATPPPPSHHRTSHETVPKLLPPPRTFTTSVPTAPTITYITSIDLVPSPTHQQHSIHHTRTHARTHTRSASPTLLPSPTDSTTSTPTTSARLSFHHSSTGGRLGLGNAHGSPHTLSGPTTSAADFDPTPEIQDLPTSMSLTSTTPTTSTRLSLHHSSTSGRLGLFNAHSSPHTLSGPTTSAAGFDPNPGETQDLPSKTTTRLTTPTPPSASRNRPTVPSPSRATPPILVNPPSSSDEVAKSTLTPIPSPFNEEDSGPTPTGSGSVITVPVESSSGGGEIDLNSAPSVFSSSTALTLESSVSSSLISDPAPTALAGFPPVGSSFTSLQLPTSSSGYLLPPNHSQQPTGHPQHNQDNPRPLSRNPVFLVLTTIVSVLALLGLIILCRKRGKRRIWSKVQAVLPNIPHSTRYVPGEVAPFYILREGDEEQGRRESSREAQSLGRFASIRSEMASLARFIDKPPRTRPRPFLQHEVHSPQHAVSDIKYDFDINGSCDWQMNPGLRLDQSPNRPLEVSYKRQGLRSNASPIPTLIPYYSGNGRHLHASSQPLHGATAGNGLHSPLERPSSTLMMLLQAGTMEGTTGMFSSFFRTGQTGMTTTSTTNLKEAEALQDKLVMLQATLATRDATRDHVKMAPVPEDLEYAQDGLGTLSYDNVPQDGTEDEPPAYASRVSSDLASHEMELGRGDSDWRDEKAVYRDPNTY